MIKCTYRFLFYEYEYFRTKKKTHDFAFLLWSIFILRIYTFLRTFSFYVENFGWIGSFNHDVCVSRSVIFDWVYLLMCLNVIFTGFLFIFKLNFF